MKMRFVAGAFALIALLAAATAQANTTQLAKVGDWEAFGGTTTSGRGVCGISASVNGEYFGFKLFAGESVFIIQLGKNTWKIENGAKQKLTLRYDDQSPWNAVGTGMHFNDGDAGMEFSVNRKELDQFMKEFSGANRVRIHFEKSNADDWVLSLAGVSSVRNAYRECLRTLK